MPPDKGFGQSKLPAERPHLVLEEFAQRLDQLHVHALGQAADIVMRLDGDGWPAGERHAFDYVGIERALRKKFRASDFPGFLFEDVNEELADGLALLLGILDACERA